jgi:hypothetical protein
MQRARYPRRRRSRNGDPVEVFQLGPPLRPMVVLVDADLVDLEIVDAPATGADTSERSQQLLADLLRLDALVVYRYADDGPPPGTPTCTDDFGETIAPGWAVVRPVERQHWTVLYGMGPERWTRSSIWGEHVDFDVLDGRTTAYADLDPAEAAGRRRADRLAAQVANQAVKADLYITERPYLHQATWPLAPDTTMCGVEDALPIVGLYLRTQGYFHISSRLKYNRGLFTWVGTRELLPSAWRWFTVTVRSDTAAGDDRLTILAGSLLQRFQRALVGRDAILVALNQPQDNDTQDDALCALDDVGYRLMGAFDVLARVAHRVCGLTSKERFASWQNTAWLNELATVAPDLADMMQPGTEGADTFTILRLLRNTIHGEALQGIHVQDSSTAPRSLVGLNHEDEAQILHAIDALGGRDRWGVEELVPGRYFVDPGVLVEEMFREVVPLLNRLMDLTPVETLPNANLTTADLVPPDGRDRAFSEPSRFSIRKQYGL